MAVYTPTDRRFRRAHVKPSRKRRVEATRRRLMRAATAFTLVGLGLYWLADVARRTPALAIATIAVEGNNRMSTGEVLALVGALRGQNILLADLDTERARLLTSGWVEDATLRRLLPATIEIVITERIPVGLGRFSDRLYLVDSVGTVIDEYGPAVADLDLPIIDGLSIGGNQEIVVDRARAQLAARLISEVDSRRELARRISEIDVHDPRDAVVLLSGDPALVHLGNERFVERLQEYLELVPVLRARVPDIDSVDLRFEQRVYVRPVGAAGGQAVRLAERGQPCTVIGH